MFPGSRQLSITEFAVPSAIEAGTNAELQCRFSEGEPVEYIKWWWTPLYVPTDDRNRVLIYQRVTGQKGELPYKKRNFGKWFGLINYLLISPTTPTY